MKVTSLIELESYIYSVVILPLKGLDVPAIEARSPISGPGGATWTLGMSREEVMGRMRHNYQRDEARRMAKQLVLLQDGHRVYVLADYAIRHHKVQIYTGEIDKCFPGANYLVNQLERAFRSTTPFGKVVISPERRDQEMYIEIEPEGDRGDSYADANLNEADDSWED